MTSRAALLEGHQLQPPRGSSNPQEKIKTPPEMSLLPRKGTIFQLAWDTQMEYLKKSYCLVFLSSSVLKNIPECEYVKLYYALHLEKIVSNLY